MLLRACEVGVKKEGTASPAKKGGAKGVIDAGMKKGALEGFFKPVAKASAAASPAKGKAKSEGAEKKEIE